MTTNDLLFEILDGSDYFSGRLTLGQLIVIAGKPASGKTALAARIINNLAINDGVPVALFSLELSKAMMSKRIVRSILAPDENRIFDEAWVSNHMFGKGKTQSTAVGPLESGIDGIFQKISNKLSNAPIQIDDTASLTIDYIKSQSKQLVDDGVRVILIDYIQLFKNFNEIGDKIIHELKELAERFGFTIIVFSQIDSTSENGEDNIFENKYALLGCFSNDMLQNADVFCVLHHPTLHEGESKENGADMYILKSTDGQNNI